MKLKRVKFQNIGHFSQLSISFPNNTLPISTVILGEQNSGKTTILKHIFQGLSWFSNRHKDPRGSGIIIPDTDIKATQLTASTFIEVQYASELGNIVNEAHAKLREDYICRWRIEKSRQTLSNLAVGNSEMAELDQLVQRYQKQIKTDKLFSTPCIAYYPVERFVYEVNMQGKNLTSTLSPLHNAYDLTTVNFTTFNKFFEWFRDVHDLENAQVAKLFKHYLDPQHRFVESQDLNAVISSLEQAYRLSSQRCIQSLRQALALVIPEVSDIELEYSPKLNLMIKHQGVLTPFLQIPQSTRIWIGLVGDLVRRLSLLNPQSLYPCLEGEGIVLIDSIDLLMDTAHLHHILPRLQQAFPRLQFIVSCESKEILENPENIQFYQLYKKKIHLIDLQQQYQELQNFYAELIPEQHVPISHTSLTSATETRETEAVTDTQLLKMAQQLSPQALQQLIHNLQQHLKESE